MWELNVIQVAQTPQTKESAKAMSKYIKQLREAAEGQVPWISVTKNIHKEKEETTASSKKSAEWIKQRMARPPQSKVIVDNDDGSLSSEEIKAWTGK